MEVVGQGTSEDDDAEMEVALEASQEEEEVAMEASAAAEEMDVAMEAAAEEELEIDVVAQDGAAVEEELEIDVVAQDAATQNIRTQLDGIERLLFSLRQHCDLADSLAAENPFHRIILNSVKGEGFERIEADTEAVATALKHLGDGIGTLLAAAAVATPKDQL